ncbi:MAG TPA: hypothetical protein VNC78_02485 [Actinomycetota bacterium]|nr:hypothetical protein [Actinomycetota bacterium]
MAGHTHAQNDDRWERRMLGGVISLLVELGRELDLALTPGSVKNARQAFGDAGQGADLPTFISDDGLAVATD